MIPYGGPYSNALHLNVADPNELFCPDKLWPAAEKGARKALLKDDLTPKDSTLYVAVEPAATTAARAAERAAGANESDAQYVQFGTGGSGRVPSAMLMG